MTALPPDITAYASALRAHLQTRDAISEILIDEIVCSAIRLKLLFRDPRAFDPFDQAWTRAHEAALRAFFRALNAHQKPKGLAARPSRNDLPALASFPLPTSTGSEAAPTPATTKQSDSVTAVEPARSMNEAPADPLSTQPLPADPPAPSTTRPHRSEPSSTSAARPSRAEPVRLAPPDRQPAPNAGRRPDPLRALKAARRAHHSGGNGPRGSASRASPG